MIYRPIWIIIVKQCPSGEIGRRTGLKIQRGKTHDGSSPSSGTIICVTRPSIYSTRSFFVILEVIKMTLKPLISVIGEYVVDELDKNKLTQRQFAKISGVSQATLVKIIRGDSKDGISTKSIDLLLKNTNTSMSELLNKYGEYK